MDSNDGWLKIDAGYTGFFRVNYHPRMWEELTSELYELDTTDPELSVEDRSGLLHDLFAFAQAPRDSPLFGPESVIQALTTVQYLSIAQELSYTPYYFALNGLNNLSPRLVNREHPDLFEDFMRDLLREVVLIVGWENDPAPAGHSRALLRSILMPAAIRYAIPEAIQTASELLREHLSTAATPLHPDVESSVWNGAGANDELFDILLELHLSGGTNANRALTALTYNRNPELIDRLLTLLVDGTVTPTTRILRDLASNNRGSRQITDHILDNWEFYCTRWCDTNEVNNLFEAAIGSFDTESERDDD
eukprot:TRINITY_DN5352_c0_g1_i1.p1 TRINITY_DN5352_c0_g1~~TRINITY_DN5352_c0_g1_i1.p1  ORF type:complete len:307 (+),score=52.94 TRINITY_DN5352_c0_g1_i1:428-1348(+)